MKNRIIHLFLWLTLVLVTTGCASRKKNTSQTRMYHAFVARYNTGFNGMQAYKTGYRAQIDANKDNYLDVLPMLPVGNEETAKAGASNFDRAIEKAQKTIKQHSITKKPIRKSGQRLTDKQKKFYAKREYNTYLHKAWMLMGNSYFQKGEYLEAASTYSYIMRLYVGEPAIAAEARIRMAQCYTELKWFYEAEDLLVKACRDTVPPSMKKELARARANYYLKQKRYSEALPFVEEAVKRSGRLKKEKAREYYLLGQVYQKVGRPQDAFNMYKKVIRTSPPYELEFSARIRQTETVQGKNVKKMIKTLESMEKNPNNENYLDQLYYAKGNIYISQNDTAKALAEYEKGIENGKSSYGKRVLLQQLSIIYWTQGKYSKAQPFYSQLVGLLTKEDSLYAEVNLRSKVLENLVVHTDNVELQDSLQHLATLPEEELLAVIDSIIEDVIKKEEEEREAAELAENMSNRDKALDEANRGRGNADVAAPITTGSLKKDNSWYFYNTEVVTQGKTAFQQKWGRRKLEDHWRRNNKTVLATDDFAEVNYDDPVDSLMNDSTMMASVEGGDSLGVEGADSASVDTVCTDPHERAYYIQQIPYTEEALAESNAILSDALYNVGLISKDELEDKEMSEDAFVRLYSTFPDFEKMEDVYYNLFLLYSRWGDTEKADSCKAWLTELYPDGKYTLTICDPDFERNARYGKHLEDSMYANTYDMYRAGDYNGVILNDTAAAVKYPLGKHRAKSMFLKAMSRLQLGHQDGFLELLKQIVTTYPQDEISELAGLIAQGLQDGRLLGSGSFGSIWERRKSGAAGQDSISDSTKVFSPDRFVPFYFILAYPEDSVDENRLLFEIARYNFTNYMVRNFDMEFVKDNGIGMLQIKEFLNFDEAYVYMKRLYAEEGMAHKLGGLRALLISKTNLDLLMSYYSFADYEEFYNRNFTTIPELDIKGYTLDEPTAGEYEIKVEDEEDAVEEE